MSDAIELLAGIDPEVGRQEFRAVRVALRKTQKAVAGECSITPTYVTRLERGSWWPKVTNGFWTLESLIRKGLGMPVADFVARCEREKSALEGVADVQHQTV